MLNRMIFVTGILLTLFIVSACSSTSTITKAPPTIAPSNTRAEYRSISIDELVDVITNQRDEYLIVNVHIPYAGEIEDTDANIAFNDLDALTSFVPDKNTPVILYCRSGNMSEQATRDLVELGYTQVYDVPGGMNAWQASGYELTSGS